MGKDTAIEWCHHTLNPWRGCSKVHTGCTHCYAETLSKRNPAVLGVWGDNGTRVIASEAMWREPIKWNREAEAAGERRRVFCASLADVFEDRPELEAPRRRLFDLICHTPHLDWLLLTKRPQHALRLMVQAGLYAVENPSLPCPQPNIWIGTSVSDQKTADEMIPALLRVPAAVRFLSVEPLLGPVDLFCECETCCGSDHPGSCMQCAGWGEWTNEGGESVPCKHCGEELTCPVCHGAAEDARIDWVIVGGESGGKARPCDVAWIRAIVQQCKTAGTACFVKQLGARPRDDSSRYERAGVTDSKGGDPSEWPADLNVREFPEVAHA